MTPALTTDNSWVTVVMKCSQCACRGSASQQTLVQKHHKQLMATEVFSSKGDGCETQRYSEFFVFRRQRKMTHLLSQPASVWALGSRFLWFLSQPPDALMHSSPSQSPDFCLTCLQFLLRRPVYSSFPQAPLPQVLHVRVSHKRPFSLGWDQLLVGQHHLNLSACPFPSR